MIELEILYTDETRARAAARDAHTLPGTGVLVIFVHSDVQIYRYYGEDFYTFGFREPNRWWIYGWDEYEEFVRARDESNPNPGAWEPLPITRIFPDGWRLTEFKGGSVSVEEWNRILPTTEGMNVSRDS